MISALASVSFLPSSDGGLTAPLTTPCRSLLLRVPGLAYDEPALFGVLISTDEDMSIRPGVEFPRVRLDFWDDVAGIHLKRGQDFALCYPTRVVAVGTIIDFVLSTP